MPLYKVDKLMDETRRLAAEYRRSTGQTLPVSGELAKNDAIRLLKLSVPEQPISGIDAVLESEQGVTKFQVKGRVIFDDSKQGQRVGQLAFDTDWDAILLVLMNGEYETTEIYSLDRATAENELQNSDGSKRSKRGAMSVAKFKIIAELVWSKSENS